MVTEIPPNTAAPIRKPSALRRGLLATGLVAGGMVLGASGLALASAGAMGWHGGFHHGPRIGMIQHVVRGALEDVGATTAQEDKIHDIIATTWTDIDKGGADREAMRKQILDLMKAPTLDREAIEKLRAEKIGEIDAKSKTLVGALVDAAGQLTPDQRAKLVQHMEERQAESGGGGPGGWGGWHHPDRMDGPDGPSGGHQPGDRGPDDSDHG